jgi:hypothetical protein
MTEHKGSVDSLEKLFGTSKTDNNDDEKLKQNDISPSSAIAALIKSQPVIHHHQTPSETKRKFFI